MAAAAEFLVDSDFNIQFGESSPSGHHHATWNVVCEAVDVRRKFEDKIKRFQHSRRPGTGRAKLHTLATELATAMYQKAVTVKQQMLQRGDFLHQRLVRPKFYLLHVPAKIHDQQARDAAVEDFPQAVRVRWIQNLPVFAFYGSDAFDPIRLKFRAEHSMLQPEAPGVSCADILAKGGIRELPTKAIASIYPEEHHVRLLPVPTRDEMEGLVQIDVKYDATFPRELGRNPAPTCDTTVGLWSGVCKCVRDRGINLRRVTNTTTRREPRSEGGVLTFIGVKNQPLSDTDLHILKSEISSLEEGESHPQARSLQVTPTASPLAIHKVFISWRAKVKRGVELRMLAEASARNWGLEPVFVDDPEGKILEDEVNTKIGQCDALFQILSVTDDELLRLRNPDSAKEGPKLGWMNHEYALAVARKIPTTRKVDVSNVPLSEWRKYLGIGGEFKTSFDLRDSDEKVRDDLDRSMQQLAKQVRGRAS
ncbi:MAG: hypothetical protein ACJ8GN_17270 [Longimicrobiaceae bacterium]